MHKNATRYLASVCAGALLIALGTIIGFAQKQPAAIQPAATVWRTPTNIDPNAYASADTCSLCHAAQAEQHAKTVHAKAAPADAKVSGCEVCHGPGKAHADAMVAASTAAETAAGKKLIFNFTGKPAENAARCMSCHSSNADNRIFESSEHKLMGVSCETCHSAHLVVEPKLKTRSAQADFFQLPALPEEARWLRESMLRKTQPDLCFTCHKTIQAMFALPTHHRVPEGLMKCTDCHQAHGTRNRPMLKKANFEVCTTCHTEKRGPFVYEHAAVKVEGCTACHSPHGTVERNLLLRREGRFLCLQCHVNPQAENVPHGRLSFTTRGECERCHVTIHGSNQSPYFLQ
jgi:predicted CXXCH cytochrome family protein